MKGEGALQVPNNGRHVRPFAARRVSEWRLGSADETAAGKWMGWPREGGWFRGSAWCGVSYDDDGGVNSQRWFWDMICHGMVGWTFFYL